MFVNNFSHLFVLVASLLYIVGADYFVVFIYSLISVPNEENITSCNDANIVIPSTSFLKLKNVSLPNYLFQQQKHTFAFRVTNESKESYSIIIR